MGPGSSWSTQELGDAAKAWIAFLCNPVVGIDQTANRLDITLHSAFISRALENSAVKVEYTMQSAKSFKF